jgi:hypothetical protein
MSITTIRLAFCVLLITLSANGSQDQSLGTVAREHRAAKASAARAITNEDFAKVKASDGGEECDDACQVDMRKAIENGSKHPMSDSEWQSRFSAGMQELQSDSEWQSLRVKSESTPLCKSQKTTPESQELIRRFTLKIMKETTETLQLMVTGFKSLGSGVDYGEKLAVKTVKLKMMSLELDRWREGCGVKKEM